MSELANYQRQLLQTLLEPESGSEKLIELFSDKNNLPARLTIYRNSVLGGRFSVMQRIFPCVQTHLGGEYFQQLVEHYLYLFPSKHMAIAQMGASFADFLSGHEVLEHAPYIAELANFEWRWYTVFHGRSNASISADSLFDPATQLIFATDAQLLHSTWPLHLLWEMAQPEYSGEFELPEDATNYFYVIVQREQAIYIERVNVDEWHMLADLPQTKGLVEYNGDSRVYDLYLRGILVKSPTR